MPIYDISVPITPGQTPIYPGDPDIVVGSWAALERGDPANVSVLHFGAHTGTHIDAPAHFIEGADEISSLSLDILVGEARVVEIPSDALAVEAAHIEEVSLVGAVRVLFKTRNSGFWKAEGSRFREDFTFITPAAAHMLVARGVRLVGIDYLSVEKFGSTDFETHLALLSNGVVIIEGLDLSAVSQGTYELTCLPLKLAAGSGDGAPARAILRTVE